LNTTLQAGLSEALGLTTEITLLKDENEQLQSIIDQIAHDLEHDMHGEAKCLAQANRSVNGLDTKGGE